MSHCWKMVGDDKLLLSAKLQQQAPVVAVSNAVSAKYSFPGNCILAHSGVEVTKDNQLICRDALKEASERRVELGESERTH